MDSIKLLFTNPVAWTHSHMTHFTVAFVASLLIIYGDNIMRFVKGHTKQYGFFMRVFIFMLMSSVGFIFLQKGLIMLVNSLMGETPNSLALPIVFAAFFLIGVLADKKHQL
jgi:hypothetical protein